MIDATRVRKLMDSCPLTEEVHGIVTHTDFEIRDDWSGDEAIYVTLFVTAPNTSDKKVLNSAISYADCLHSSLTSAGSKAGAGLNLNASLLP